MFFVHFGYRSIFFCSLIITAGLIGCSPSLVHHDRIDSAEDAANVYVSAYPAIPWTDISAKLEPKNNLTIIDARNMATQTTQVQVSQFLSTFAAGLGLGLPLKTENLTTTIGASSEQTTGTRTRSYGTVPSSSGMPSTSVTNPTPDLSKGPGAPVGIDANTLLTAGTALYQQAQILDNQISKGILPEGYQAHLVTLQVNVQPKQRDVSYDAYMDVSLLPGTWKEALDTSEKTYKSVDGLPPVMVYPLVIMDALETSSVGRAIEAIRQAAFQLSGVVGNIGVNGGLAGGTTNANSIVGLDKNSLVTVGRISDHTVRIRLGAENSGSAGLALVPRSYNISLVVLTRWERDEKKRVTSIQATTHTTLVSTENGGSIESKICRPVLAQKVHDYVTGYGFSLVNTPACISSGSPSRQSISFFAWFNPCHRKLEPMDIADLDLLQAVDRSDYNYVGACLYSADPSITRGAPQYEIALRRLLAKLIEIQAESRYSNLQISLQHPSEPTLPNENQLAIYSDDGKHTTTVVLRGGKGLDLKHLKAALQVKNTPPKPISKGKTKGKGATPTQAAPIPSNANLLLPTAITMTGDGSEIDISFPSLVQSGLALTDQGEVNKPLFFAINDKTSHGESVDIKKADGETVAHYALRETKAVAEPVNNPVTASSAVLISDLNGVARVTLQVGEFPDSTKVPGPLQLTVKGADVRADAAIGATAVTSKGVSLTAKSVLTLELGNLTPVSQVILTTTDSQDHPIGNPITFTVDRGEHTIK